MIIQAYKIKHLQYLRQHRASCHIDIIVAMGSTDDQQCSPTILFFYIETEIFIVFFLYKYVKIMKK